MARYSRRGRGRVGRRRFTSRRKKSNRSNRKFTSYTVSRGGIRL